MEDSVSEDTSDSEYSMSITDHTPTPAEISMLLSQVSYITDIVKFLDSVFFSKAILSDNLVLGVFSLVKYEDVRGCLAKNLKKNINGLLEKIQHPEGTVLLFCPRIINLPLRSVFDLFQTGFNQSNFDRCIVISRLETLKKDEQEEMQRSFPEFKRDDLVHFPCFTEQIFMLHSKLRQNTEIDGKPARIHILSRDEFSRFLINFKSEIEQNE